MPSKKVKGSNPLPKTLKPFVAGRMGTVTGRFKSTELVLREVQPGEGIITKLLREIGEDPKREGLRETPARVMKAWGEWCAGYKTDITALLKAFADGAEGAKEMVVVANIPFYSHCEHHLAPFFGVAHVGYLPNGRIVGLSKIPRLVDAFAQRLQVQERLTSQIVDALCNGLEPLGAGCVVEARHLCMESRGIKRPGSVTVTSALRGAMYEKEPRAEFLSLVRQRSEGVR